MQTQKGNGCWRQMLSGHPFTACCTGLSESPNCHHWYQPMEPNATFVIVLFWAWRPIWALQPSVAGILIVILCPLNKHTQGLYPRESQPKRHSPTMKQRQLNANFSLTPLCPLAPLGWDKKRGEGRERIDGKAEEDQNKQTNRQTKRTGNSAKPRSPE